MKVGLDARHLTHPQEGGFKTYTQSLIPALARVDKTNEYVLYTDRPSNEDFHLGENFRIRMVQGALPVREQVAMPIALARDGVDVAHFLSNTAPILTRCPLVLTVHDVIPCLPEASLQQRSTRRARLLDKYWREVIPIAASRASRVVTVSESSSIDIQRVLGIPAEQIRVLHNGIDPSFRPLEAAETNAVLQRYNLLGRRYVLGFLSKEARKNSVGLINSYRIVAAGMPDINLVLVCNSRDALSTVSEDTLRDTRISVLNGVSRNDLVALYNGAAVLVFPSFAEGFGFPIVEAMACGTPVVCSNAGSLPEVAGEAAIFVNPQDTRGFAEAIVAVLASEVLSHRLRVHGLRQASRFSWDETARRLIDVYAEAAGVGGNEFHDSTLEETPPSPTNQQGEEP
ncbi:MAG: glycosyltransferase family 1 protein [Armatimonadota bacterium]|nr:glycosyltransferase family 1 protein [Armatimonadota bacterium]